MPKPIKLTIEIEQVAMGKVWTTLDAMSGVISISLHGSGPKPAGPKKAGKPGGKSTTVPCLILGALVASKDPLPRTDLMLAVEAGGRAATSTPDSLAKLKKDKHIAPAGDGLYKITAAGVKRYETACKIGTE